MEFTNDMEYIDSRDILERIEELEDLLEDALAEEELEEWELHELECLRTIEAEWGDPRSFRDGITLINEGFWVEYVRELAWDLGLVNDKDYQWPYNHINWDEAAEELLIDYQEVDFDGVTYYARE